jgi:hypothetical protein
MNVIRVYKFLIDSLTNRIDLVFYENIKYSSMKSQMIIILQKKTVGYHLPQIWLPQMHP